MSQFGRQSASFSGLSLDGKCDWSSVLFALEQDLGRVVLGEEVCEEKS